MLPAAHLIPQNVHGYGLSDNGCSVVSGSALKVSPCSSHNDYIRFPYVKVSPSGCTSWGSMSSICNASSSGQRRNPDFSRKIRHGFSRNKNTLNEGRDITGHLEDVETFFSKSAMPLLFGSASPKFQDTATTGPREREIVELFRKVQVQLRERAALKEEKKVEDSQEPNKQNETGGSLFGLRKHSSHHGKRSSSSSSDNNSRDFTIDKTKQNSSFAEDRSTNSFASNNNVKHEVQDSKVPSVSRPVSNFQRRSPVPKFKYHLILSGKAAVNPGSYTDRKKKNMKSDSTPEPESAPEPKLELKVETESTPQVKSEPFLTTQGMFDKVSVNEIETFYIEDSADETDNAEEEKASQRSDLSGMKLPELRAVAKSRGLKGLSKLKKGELFQLLTSSGTI